MNFYLLIASFFLIALIYSSVGFAGGTSYVALMAVMGISFAVLRPTALMCNILVATGGTAIFYKENLLDIRKNWLFLVTSIPCAFFGGFWPVKENTFFLVLGITLVIASIFLWIKKSEQIPDSIDSTKANAIPLATGGAIGFLSGMTSIGGGIFLSPLLHFINWDSARKISALASLFILVNSISGLAGQLSQSSVIDWNFVWPLMASVFVGGQIGSRLGAKTFNPLYIKRITAVLILVAGINILKDRL